jgi:type IV secretion system protein VirB10
MPDDDQNQNHEPNTKVERDAGGPGGAEREALVRKRRARQTGASRQRRDPKLTMALALLVGGVIVFAIVAGPRSAMRIFGIGKSDQRTSKVSLEVDNQADPQSRLDFVVPADAEPEVKKDPDTGNRQSGLSNADIQKLLASYNDSMTRKLDSERKAMAEETARLRAEAEAERLRTANLAESQKIDQKQRESNAVIVDGGGGSAAPAGGLAAAGDGSVDLNANERFLKSAASSVVQTSVSQKLPDPSRTVVQGTIISAVLETAIDTELPGSIRAQVMQPVYSFDGTQVLMPSGTILIGQFNNDVDIAQQRVLIAWNRAITPEGKSIALGSIGTDTLGRSGTIGNVDNRYATKFGAAILISAITAAPAALAGHQGGQADSSGTTINVGGGGKLASSVGDTVSGQGNDMLKKYLSLPPVIRIPQGEEIRIFANRDLVFL